MGDTNAGHIKAEPKTKMATEPGHQPVLCSDCGLHESLFGQNKAWLKSNLKLDCMMIAVCDGSEGGAEWGC